jgi:arsenate reductase-like glutaredoxin family protein
MKKEEIEVLRRNGVDHSRINYLKKELEGYKELKKEVNKIEKLLVKKEKEVAALQSQILKSKKRDLIEGLK